MGIYRKRSGAWYMLDNSFNKTKVAGNDPYLNLAGAILKQAVAEYIDALVDNNKYAVNKLEKFFLSEWGQTLSFQQGEYIIERAKKEALEKAVRIQDMKTKYMKKCAKTKHL